MNTEEENMKKLTNEEQEFYFKNKSIINEIIIRVNTVENNGNATDIIDLKTLEENLKDLNNKLTEFCFFTPLNLDNLEVMHSSILAWLLGKKNFLTEFFNQVIIPEKSPKKTDTKEKYLIPLKTDTLDNLFKAEKINIKTEKAINNGRMDILITCKKPKFVCVIENKTQTTDHSNQLWKYGKFLDENFEDYEKLGVYIHPSAKQDEFKFDKEYAYIQMNYCNVISALNNAIKEETIKKEKSFMKQYKILLEKETDINNMCNNIYNKYSNFFNKIQNRKTDIKKSFKNKKLYLYKDDTKLKQVHFLSKEIFEKLPKGKNEKTLFGKLLSLTYNYNDDCFMVNNQPSEDNNNNDKRNKKIKKLEQDLKTNFEGYGNEWRWATLPEKINKATFENVNEIIKDLENEIINNLPPDQK